MMMMMMKDLTDSLPMSDDQPLLSYT